MKHCNCGKVHSLDDIITKEWGTYVLADSNTEFFSEVLIEFKCDCGSHIAIWQKDLEVSND